MPTYCERKKQKKSKKYANILFKDWGIKVSDMPSKHLMICNAGLLSGISEADMVDYFSLYGHIEKVCMIPGKSYAFVSFSHVASAISCVSQAIDRNESNFGILYILYIDHLPEMESLYDDYDYKPPGLIIVEDFISESEEKLLSNCTMILENNSDKVMKHRSVKHYGFAFEYGTNDVNKNRPLEDKIPVEFDFLEERFKKNKLEEVIKWLPDQLTVNCYAPGQGIPPHVDTHSAFEDPILSLSLLSDVVMEFEKCDKSRKSSILVPRRSLLVMSGESRYFWTHGITPRKSDVHRSCNGLTVLPRKIRISCTFRKIRKCDCNCIYRSVCDSFIKNNLRTPSDESAVKIESEYVHKVYESISDHFSLTRHSPWPKVHDFIKSLPAGAFLIDIGCGNGKYFNLNKTIFHVGGDTCSKLTAICKEQGEVLLFNCLALPFCDNIADAIICIAVLHHLSTASRRIHALKEIYRALKPNGKALIYVWAMEQKSTNYLNKKTSDVDVAIDEKAEAEPVSLTTAAFVNETDVLPIHSNRTGFQHNDLLVPWNLRLKDIKETCHLRYYHVFREGELDEMCINIGASVKNSYYDDGNWCVEIQK